MSWESFLFGDVPSVGEIVQSVFIGFVLQGLVWLCWQDNPVGIDERKGSSS